MYMTQNAYIHLHSPGAFAAVDLDVSVYGGATRDQQLTNAATCFAALRTRLLTAVTAPNAGNVLRLAFQ
jgi:hypothetical protein